MGIYRVTIAGRKNPLLLKAENLHEAKAAIVTAESLNADDMAAALEKGEKVWRAGDPFPVEEPEYKLADARFEAGEAFEAGALVMLGGDGKIYKAPMAEGSANEE